MIYMIVYSKMFRHCRKEFMLTINYLLKLQVETPLKGNKLMTNSIIPTNDNFYSCKSSHVL